MKPFKCLHYVVLLVVAVFATHSVAWAEWKEKVLYSFQGGTDGATPAGGVVFDTAGNLYGATTDGGSASCNSIAQCGTVYQLAPPAKQGDPWTETVLYVFKGNAANDGASPSGGVVMDSAGNLYGTTAYGGTGDCVLLGSKLGCGTVYRLSPPKQKGGAWIETVLYSFPTAQQGYLPNGDLVFDSAGNLYGATEFGGGHGTTCNSLYQYCGAVFKLSPPKTKGGKWTEKVLHGFKGGTDGANPNGGLVLDSKGEVYGTTNAGGNQSCKYNSSVGCGTAFELKSPSKTDDTWAEEILHRFTDGADGASPSAGLTPKNDGAFYGAAGGGGKYLSGLVFRLARTMTGQWTEHVLYNFVGNKDGQNPAGLILDAAGNLYGGASGGQKFRGLVFSLRRPEHGTSWSLADIYNFAGPPDGAGPGAGLVFDDIGNLYSTTVVGGDGTGCTNGCGTVYEASPQVFLLSK